jgi:hypothetical protein
MTRLTLTAGVATFLLGAIALPPLARAETIPFHAALNTASEVPPKTGDGKGATEATLDTASKKLNYTITYSGLSGPASAAHIHGPAEAAANAAVMVPFPAPVTSPIKGTVTLTDAQITNLEAGKTYVNVHTAANPGGEIRGQLVKGK